MSSKYFTKNCTGQNDRSFFVNNHYNFEQEAIENVDLETVLDLENHSKLHVLSGGTKVVQHSPPSKTGPGLKGNPPFIFSRIFLKIG